MKIGIQKIITKQEKVSLKSLSILNCGSIDVESVRLKIYYKAEEIGYGQLNIATNWATITITLGEDQMSWEDAQELEQYLVESIEKRIIGMYAKAPISQG